MDAHANLAIAKLANNPGTTGKTITVGTGEGASFPPTPFNAFVFPEGQYPSKANCEIVRISNRGGDSLTIETRKAESGSGERNMIAGDLIIAGATVRTFTDIETAITTEVARAIESEGELGNLLSETETRNAELESKVAVIEARLGGISGTGKPIVTTLALVGATHTPESMTIKGEVNPNGATTEWWVEYGETEALGNISTKVTGLTGTTAQAVEKTLSAASPGSLTAGLFFRVVAKNSNGETRGAIMQPSPTVTERPTASYGSTPITNISTAGFTGNAIVNANGEETTLTWEYGSATVSEKTKVSSEKPTGRVGVNTSTAVVITLTAGTTYKYRLKAVNGVGTTTLAEGTFTVGSTAETLIGDQTAYTVEAHTSKGRVESFPFTVKKTGTLEKIAFKTKEAATDEPTLSEVKVAVIKDDGTGKPVIEAVLAEGSSAAAAIKEAEKEVVINLAASLSVVAGEKLWLAILPVGGGKLHFHASVASGGEKTYESGSVEGVHTTIGTTVKGWESNGSQAPAQVWGIGTTTTVSNVPTLKEASNKEEVEWASIGGESEYELRISKNPISVSGRIAAIFSQVKTTNPQKFKPKGNTTYGSSPQVTITPGSTAYIEVRVAGTSEWSNGIGIAIPAESEPSTATKKGPEMGGWGASEETGDLEEAKANVVRLSKPTPARVAELQAKGISVVYLYPYDTGGQNKSGVKAINRSAWVADAMKRIKEAKPAYFECLNEPGGSWFWGETSSLAVEAEAYMKLLELLWTEVQKLSSGERPKIIASLDGGKSTSKQWVEEMKKANASYTTFFNLGCLHAYYKVGGNSTGKLGNRGNIEACYAYMGSSKHVCVTEIGWPTLKETGDSYKYTEGEQAEAVGGFLAWAKGKGYVDLVTIYGYRDGSGEPPGYGLWHLDDSPKPAVPKLAAA